MGCWRRIELEEKCTRLALDLNHMIEVEVERLTRLAEEEFVKIKSKVQEDMRKVEHTRSPLMTCDDSSND